MGKLIGTAVCIGLSACAASGQYDIHFYFSTQEHANSIPPEFTGRYNPVGSIGQTLYLWAFVEDDGGQGATPYGVWNAIGLGFDELAVGTWYQQPVSGTSRWNANSTLSWTPGAQGGTVGAFGVAVMERGLGDPILELLAVPKRVIREPDGVPPHYGPGYHYILSDLTLETFDGKGWLSVGMSGIGRKDGNILLDKVYFGWTIPTPPQPDPAGGWVPYPDIIPEPGSVWLIGLVGLVLRRR